MYLQLNIQSTPHDIFRAVLIIVKHTNHAENSEERSIMLHVYLIKIFPWRNLQQTI